MILIRLIPSMADINNTKYPIEYGKEAQITLPKNIEVLHDTNSQLILAFPSGDRMTISVTPGSKIFSQATENNIGNSQSVNATTIRGPINADTVKTVNANTITGQIEANQIGSVNANTITGQITSDHIDTINASQITGSITSTQIGSVAANTITVGKLESTQINSIDVGAMTIYGSLSADHTEADVTATSDFVTTTYPNDKANLEASIDNKIVSWFTDTDPSATWEGTDSSHAGDMWWNTSTHKLKRYSGTAWSSDIEDQKAIDAYTNAATAQDTADEKRRVFVSEPVPPYDIGDLWAEGSSGDIKKCKTARATGSFDATEWELASKYDKTAESEFVTVTYPADQTNIQNQIDGKIVSWFQDSDPNTWSEADRPKHNGDMWYNSTSHLLKRYNSSSNSWELIEDQKAIDAYSNAATAQDTADHKRRVFTSQPTTPYDVGDLWSDGPAGDLKKCKTSRSTGSYDSGDWELASKYDKTQDALDAGASIDNAKAYGNTLIQGGFINTNILTADNIQTGTLTGITIQTAASGQRTVLTSTYEQYDSANHTNVAQIYADDGGLIITSNLDNSNISVDPKNAFAVVINGTLEYAFYADQLGMKGNKITDLGAPTDDNDAATKTYVDNHSSNFTCSDLSSCSLDNLYPGLYIQSSAPTGVTNRLWVDTS